MAEETVICTYRVRRGSEQTFEDLLARHWPTLHELGVVTDQPAAIYRSLDDKAPVYVEIFDWRAGGYQRAHEHPRVVAIWEPMDACCEARDGRPGMEFPHFRHVAPVASS